MDIIYVSNEEPYLSDISSKFVVLLLHRLAKSYVKHRVVSCLPTCHIVFTLLCNTLALNL